MYNIVSLLDLPNEIFDDFSKHCYNDKFDLFVIFSTSVR